MTAVPRLPLLAPWYRLVGLDDRMLLEHGQTVVVLEGDAVRTLLPALLPLLDGTRSHDELAARLGVGARPALDHALEVLAAHGLLVEGPPAPREVASAADAVAATYGLAPDLAARRLRSAVVGVVGASASALEIARLLRLCGVGTVRRCRWHGRDRFDVAVVAPAGDELHRLRSWNRMALAQPRPWLPIGPYDGRYAAVGPLIVPGETCCFECVRRRRAANLAYGELLDDLETVPTAATVDAALGAMVVGVAAHVVLRWLGGCDTTLAGVLFAVEARPALSVGDHPVLRHPRCPACSPAERLASRLPWHREEAA